MAELYVALLHHPVVDKEGRVVTSSVTNIDVHDIARSCRTYGVAAFYVVTPVDALRGLVRRIMQHWETGLGKDYNPNRSEALAGVRLERTLDGVEIDIERMHGVAPSLVATSARRSPDGPPIVGFEALAARLDRAGPARIPSEAGASPAFAGNSPVNPKEIDRPVLMLLGTAWGLAPEVLARTEALLPPICGPGEYNHLSVRAAAAVLLDRLRGTR
jgi:hypothetical protein